MSVITLDEENKKRIQRYIKQQVGFYGYEQDIALLEREGVLTEELARKVFSKVMSKAQTIRSILTPEENDEFLEQMNEVYSKYDKIPKPEQLEKYGYYDGAYRNMEFEDVYANMQTAFEVIELDTQYYACRDLRDIANTVINSINGIDKYKIELQPEVMTELQEIQEELKNLLAQEKTDIQAIQDRVDKYNSHAMDIWNDYLTSIDDTKSSEYRWVVHNLTKGELQGDFRDKYMSTSIITNNAMGLYGRANYGLIIKPKHIVSASYKDSYTLNDREDEDNLFNIRRPPLMLPQEIEEVCMQQTIEANGELLNYEKAPIYPEIVVDDYVIEGMYYISNGEHELARNYDRAKKMAEERGLPLIERDISKYRAEHGLEAMTEITKRSLFGDILRRCCEGDKELQGVYYTHYHSFVDTHFQEFYEQYMRLKEKGDYSKDDILKVFSEIARDDIHFQKIQQNVEEMYLTDKEKKQLRLEREYGLNNISDRENLQQRLEKIVSDGIFYGADIQNPDKAKKFEEIKKVIPQFEEFKSVYLQLRQAGLEDDLYANMNFQNVSFDDLLERATIILEEKAKAEVQRTEIEQPEVVTNPEQVVEEIIEDEPSVAGETIEDTTATVTGTNIDIDSASMMEAHLEYMRNHQIQQTAQVVEDYWNEIHSQQAKVYEQPQPEKIRPREKSIKDEVGDELRTTEQHTQKQDNPSVDLWMNRFNGWYSAIDRVSQGVKEKFVKMKSDIIKAISEKLKERTNNRQFNKQKQNTNER